MATDRQDWNGQTVLVTGASGFIGRHLVRRLTETGARVVAAAFPPPEAATLPPGAQQVVLDVTDRTGVLQIVAQAHAEVIFHLAAAGVSDASIDPLTALEINTRGTLHLLEAVAVHPPRRLVLTGTSYEYGNVECEGHAHLDPHNAYAASKAAAWSFARACWHTQRTPVVTARLFQVYGPGQPAHSLIPAAICAALAGDDLPLTPGEQERDWIYIDDVIDGLLATATAAGIDGQSVDLGTGQTVAVREIVEQIWAMTGTRGRVQIGALPYRPGEVMCAAADAERTAHLTGWRAQTSLDDGLHQTIAAMSKFTTGHFSTSLDPDERR